MVARSHVVNEDGYPHVPWEKSSQCTDKFCGHLNLYLHKSAADADG